MEPNKNSEEKWLILTIVVAVCITAFILPQLVFYPWRMVPNLLGDGGKNTFTYLYHVLYDRGVWFTGMNYPYGEHIVFTDGQPLLSIPLSYIHPSIGIAFAITGWLTALSYVLAIVFVYKILIAFSVRPPAAIVFGVLIAVFTPQLAGIPGHYALAYSCIIPMLFYWTVQYYRSTRWTYPLYIFITGLLFSFLHPYYAALTFVWVAAYAIGYFIFSANSLRGRLTHTCRILAAPLMIFAIVAVFMKLTDPYKGRPLTPFSSTDNYTSFSKILTSPFSPIWSFLKDHGIITNVNENADGGSYVGIAVTFIVLIAFIIAVWRKAQRQPRKYVFDPIWLFMAFSVLIFSMGIPFIWHMEWLLDYIPVFKQFRTLARFSWIFYYIITVYSVVVLHAWFAALLQHRKPLAYLILLFPAVVWAYEANAVTSFIRKLLYNGEDNYYILSGKKDVYWQKFLADHNRKPTDFQATIILPFFAIGSEKIWIDGSIFGITQALAAGTQLHLPTVDGMMSRTSWSVAEKQVKLAAGPYAHKPILDDIKDDRPLLLIDMGLDTFDVDQKYMLQASDYIGDYSNSKIYACYPARIALNDKRHIDEVNAILPLLTATDTCIGGNGSWKAEHFSIPSAAALFISHALPLAQQTDDVIATLSMKAADGNRMYEFSCWSLVSKDDYKTPAYLLTFFDSANNIIGKQYVMTKNSTDNFGPWFRAGQYFMMPGNCRKITISTERNTAAYKTLDELLIRPADAVVISKDELGNVMVNNHLFHARQ